MALGEQLRNARLSRNETIAQVAAATQMMAQVVEDIEHEQFQRVSAPIYAKGFIKLYARHVGLDPLPLIQEYMTRFAYAPRPSLTSVQQGGRSEADVRPRPAAGATIQTRPETTTTMAAPRPPEEREEPAAPWMDWSGVRSTLSDIAGTALGALKKAWASAGTGRRGIHESVQKRSWFRNRPAGSYLKYVPVAIGIILILVFLVSSLSRIWVKTPRPGAPVPLNESKEEVRLVIEPPAPYVD